MEKLLIDLNPLQIHIVPLSATTINLTGITDDMVENAPEVEAVLKRFHDWTGDAILVPIMPHLIWDF